MMKGNRWVRLPESTERMMKWEGKRVIVLGLARQGIALTRYFAKGGAEVVVSDLKPREALSEARQALSDLPVEYVFGGHPPALLERADLLCLSGGVPADLPLALQARELGIKVTNDAQLFLEICPATVIGITGSAGKSTVTTLVGRMALSQFEDTESSAWIGGNIGRPLLADLPDIGADDLVIMELSSFQLELMTISPPVAGVLNVTPNHLDRHLTMEAYTAAKSRILDFQSSEDVAILGREDPGAWALREKVRGRLISFGWSAPEEGDGTYIEDGIIMLRLGMNDVELSPVGEVELRGEHNLLNVLASCAIAGAVDISPQAMVAGIRGFQGIEHRLEFVRRIDGVDWYNDSIATSPERTIAAIRAFDEPLVLLAGGRDKDLPWGDFATLVRQRIDHLILFGEAAEKIAQVIKTSPGPNKIQSFEVCDGLEAAVHLAKRVAEAGDVVLLAPGGTSFDEFNDFAERGEAYRAWVEGL
ncbi:MAG TPA: UDP-N-acetylmuramoyl-L-alanine--D-glutamate ligase [Anaerolineae bacterium]|nr:UDP-N-acetylmuramoyl-L-alanine--D-glutamate ligase [Anaerolineae bacterium]